MSAQDSLKDGYENIDQTAPVWNDENKANDSLLDEKEQQQKFISAMDSLKQQRYWPTSEHIRYLNGWYKFGSKQLSKIQAAMETKTIEQVRSHQQKYLKKLEKYIQCAEKATN